MEDSFEKLKLLNYVQNFCVPHNLKPLHKFYFAIPAANTNEQWFYFTSLVAWLLQQNKVKFETPGQFDDPNAVAANILSELKNIGITADIGPQKLKLGYGDGVIALLNLALDKTIERLGIKVDKPTFPANEYPEEAEVDADAEVRTEVIDEQITEDFPEEEENFEGMSKVQTVKDERFDSKKDISMIEPSVDPAKWKLEVERVAPLLKVVLVDDNKDWRLHIQQMKQNHQIISSALSDIKGQLDKVHGEIQKTLEKIKSRESNINNHFATLIDEHKAAKQKTQTAKDKYNSSSGKINTLTNELSKVSEELDHVKTQMDELGSGMTNSQPLIRVKQALNRLKADIKQMDLRIGVVQHTLLNAKLRNKTIQVSDMAKFDANNPIEVFAAKVH